MAKKAFSFDPIALPSYPSITTTQNLAACSDHLAVACNEQLHILTSRRDSTKQSSLSQYQQTHPKEKHHNQHPQWHVTTVRTNTFEERDWPTQALATLSHLSIGEEQSNCSIHSMSWSSEGLGMHKRCVLGVLTTNLVLSLWETDGVIDSWKRTGLINHWMQDKTKDLGWGEERRKARVRAFCWSPVVLGVHHLLVVDDKACMTLFRIKKSGLGFGGWEVHQALKHEIEEVVIPPAKMRLLSPLQQRIYKQAPLASIQQDDWQLNVLISSEKAVSVYSSTITTTRSNQQHSLTLRITVPAGDEDYEDLHANTGIFAKVAAFKYETSSIQDSDEILGLKSIEKSRVDSAKHFEDVLTPVCKKFDEENDLCGHYRVRFWGMTDLLRGGIMAACITLHPLDMIEHSIPSTERCLVIFAKLAMDDMHLQQDLLSEFEVQRKINSFVTESSEKCQSSTSDYDARLLQVHQRLSQQLAGMSNLAGSGSAQSGLPKLLAAANYQATSQSTAPERCEICSADIPFIGDTISATCNTGHHFTRCNLSFVSIQEPGISKYCSGCGKQFLDLAKLETDNGPSLCQALFNVFDVCPYCQAKFRG